MIVGIDEVGRGPWAGPLVMGAVVLGCEIEGLTDSKKLSKKRREALSSEILQKASAVGLGWVNAREIDEIGLSRALEECCKRALAEIKVPYHEIIIDGTVNFLKSTGKGRYVTLMKKADLLVPTVSAASIVAKVARDRFMEEQDILHPEYGFKSHVGYGTALHRAAIEKFGVTSLHRLSFAPLQKYAVLSDEQPTPKQTILRRSVFSKASSFSAKLPKGQTFSKSEETSVKTPGQNRNVSEQSIRPTTRAIGNASETVAAEELIRRGHEILDRNWKTKYCEIDIISKKDDVIYFTEVKHRRNARAGGGVAAITPKKLNQMKFAARLYAQHEKLQEIDLRPVVIASSGDIPVVSEYIELE